MKRLGYLFVGLFVVLTIFLPLAVVILLSLAPRWGYEIIPVEYSLKWWEMLLHPKIVRAIVNTVVVSGVATTLGTVFSLYVSYILNFHEFRGKEFLHWLMLSPLYVASIVTALGILTMFTMIRNTPWILIIGNFLIVVPVIFRPIYGVMGKINKNIIEAAKSLGASMYEVFRDVVLPLSKSGIIAGAVLGIGLSISELGITILLYGPSWYTLAVQTYIESQWGTMGIAAALGTIMIVVSATGVLLINKLGVEMTV